MKTKILIILLLGIIFIGLMGCTTAKKAGRGLLKGGTELMKGVALGREGYRKERGLPPRERKKDCRLCDGTGLVTCSVCWGSGQGFVRGMRCSPCKGRGLVKCRTCKGKGYKD